MTKVYNKLVRDKIPEIIEADGGKPVTRILEENAVMPALILKFDEEVDEFVVDPSLGELADIQEVVLALAGLIGVTPEQLEQARAEKAEARGGFDKHIFLERVDD